MSKFNIIFLSSEGAGHINACVGLAQELAKRGHTIHFFANKSMVGSFEKLGFKEIIWNETKRQDDEGKNLRETILKSDLLADLSPYDQLDVFDRHKNDHFFGITMIRDIRQVHQQIEQSIREKRPDLIIVDYILIPPCIAYGNVPWAYLCSHNPLHLFNSQLLPPITSGLPTDDRSGWADFYDKFRNSYQSSLQYCQNELNKHYGFPEVNKDQFLFLSPYFNIYGYPEQLDYTDIITLPDHFVRLDAFCRQSNEPFELPDNFKVKMAAGSKLIYFSLGTFGSTNVKLMQKIIDELATCPHLIIVSTGPSHQQLSLGATNNMWGQPHLPQMSILPVVDLVITHGGNNTVTETMAHGKPMIVMPLFADQHDNAQRVMEKGYGHRINPHRFKPKQLNQMIEQILTDNALIERCAKAGHDIRNSNSKLKACEKIEKLLSTYPKKG
ncbi:hypothetical protein BLA29_005821 [Euroglyphus maynei]|uniref:UDP-glucuronosyltransferase n=1 Tax=Euroglyphus maynei TaxID=6958 RepID=A0A1Y3BKM3_EURMA|nr:hypothetical protein BLA29_005821 [Euroglyphus maynei]